MIDMKGTQVIYTPMYIGNSSLHLFEAMQKQPDFVEDGILCFPLTMVKENLSSAGAELVMMQKALDAKDSATHALLSLGVSQLESKITTFMQKVPGDAFGTTMVDELQAQKELLKETDCIFIDASILDTALGQWYLCTAEELRRDVWAIGQGTHMSLLAPAYIRGVLFVPSVLELKKILKMVYKFENE